ncbi:aldehyde dehydrogenase family protein [Cupriavidus pinatubonensis]|uniref:aldehyde dehydrogenase family protein n=1 Tax=Cupriavidus pinatubonensis TaxID=248026 RepID=UPI0011278881|nr:aldehyde dehydrogenase family protein [Cupriavidus pinatubonensis]TPQ37986.1 aldehyde dehydrogenase family protein [Cupriavidus pinatubonensis]
MQIIDTFYINGEWVAPTRLELANIVNPATEATIGQVAMGNAEDVARAVGAARLAFPGWSETSREFRIALLERIIACYEARLEDLAAAVSQEMGAPISLARNAQAPAGLGHLHSTLEALRHFEFEVARGRQRIRREAIGVAALITPWNWPLNQIAAKVAPALAAGCTVVLKPSEITPLDARIFAEILHEAGTPPGVFNLLYGDGTVVGAALSSHPDVDMVSFTGSTRAGVQVAVNAAPTVKRVAQELGGKSALLVLDDADLEAAVRGGVLECMANSGQTCIAPTRLLVPRERQAEAANIAGATAAAVRVGDPADTATAMGPVSNRAQYGRVQTMIATGLEEGARLVTGGTGRPDGLAQGFYVKPTVFAEVRNDMAIAREEVFGPVIVIIPYDDEEDAIAIANDSPYGLAGYISSGDAARAHRVANRLRVGQVRINGAPLDYSMPFGGYKHSGNGREFGPEGIAEYLEIKSVVG